MTWYAPLSGINSIVTPAVGDGVFIAPGVTISTYANGPTGIGAWLQGAESHLLVYGTVVSTTNLAIKVGSVDSAAGHDITIMPGAQIRTFANFAAFLALGNNTKMSNAGLIEGLGAIQFFGDDPLATTTFVNSGTVKGVNTAITHFGDAKLAIANTGLISAAEALDGSIGVDAVTNTGRILGDVNLLGGNDVYAGANGRLTGKVFGGVGVDSLTGGIDGDWFEGGTENDTLVGNAGNDRLIGDDGLDNLLGGIGLDILDGGNQNDTLNGGTQNDTLNGGNHNDTLIGGLGRDILTGGLNNDLFVYLTKADSVVGGNADRVMDFDDGGGNDTINLAALFGPAMTYRHNLAFTGAGQVRINDIAGADVLVEVNTGGTLAPDFAIRLVATTLASMTKSDFIL